MMSPDTESHLQAAEAHLLEVGRAFPAISEETKARLAMATVHLQVVAAYQAKDLVTAVEELKAQLRKINDNGVEIARWWSPLAWHQRPRWWEFWKRVGNTNIGV